MNADQVFDMIFDALNDSINKNRRNIFITPEQRKPLVAAIEAAESAAIVAQAARIAELEAALRWLGEMADYAESNLDADWKAKNGADYRDALAQARAALGGAK